MSNKIERFDSDNIGMSDEKVFVSATMFRCENADLPTHEVEELMKELEKGVYF